ncbi:CRISPR-associated helicase Cas3' [Gallaecimonas sp. GXIMD4217]|uniref:CRISPR-associated helicase Cas3' n=1 Tax=Gallaecimonas sp. GXIMD4217 TaxID=3131927 RepID=UPI00311B303B
MTASYFHYWGKAQQQEGHQGDAYHLLPYHCLDVAAVGWQLLADDRPLTRSLAQFLELSPGELRAIFTFALALHDLGKFSSAFQALKSFPGTPLVSHRPEQAYDARRARHDMLGQYFWLMATRGRRLRGAELGLGDADLSRPTPLLDSLNCLLDTVFGHHGYPIAHGKRAELGRYCREQDLDAATHFIADLARLFAVSWPPEKMTDRHWLARLRQLSWHLSGLAILSDWVGSDSAFFHYRAGGFSLAEYWPQAKDIAARALAATDLAKPVSVQPFGSIQEHYGFRPTPLQGWAESVPLGEGPQLFILEDVTGAGKTEAALALAHRLLAAGRADGFYFGLPTMATSNAMFSRVAGHYRQMLALDGGRASIVLAHGAREMNEAFKEALAVPGADEAGYDRDDGTASAYCNAWLADSRKKALLAPVGVGTIDQALMAVLPRKHQPLRLLGLNRKVLLFDEIHAADAFMFELLEDLLRVHLHQGGSAILLTATLSKRQRARLCQIWQQAGGVTPQLPESTHFPLATRVCLADGVQETPLASRKEVSRHLPVDFLASEESCLQAITEARAKGQCVVWIRNSVDDALKAYQALVGRLEGGPEPILFHSRFALKDRKGIEEQVLSRFGKGSGGEQRKGQVLIATQVFQESIDADADLMISDLCPIDDLIQRAGRLHRHTRDGDGHYRPGIRDARARPLLYVLVPPWQEEPQADWLGATMPHTEAVYRSPGRLWLGMQALRELGGIWMPGKARELIEAVYGEDAYQRMPQALRDKEDAHYAEERGKAAKARNQYIQWPLGYSQESNTAWHDDDIEISTRHSDIEILPVLLLRRSQAGGLCLWAEGEPQPVQNSILKLGRKKFAERLAPLKGEDIQAFEAIQARYSQARYLQPWLAQEDEQFGYSPTLGVFTRHKEVE